MQNIVLELIINVLMAGLLLATLVYCRKLNSRIQLLQDSKSELARIIREFDESTQRATQSIADIHAATNRISDNIQHKIDKANFLADDLQYMIEKSQKLAGKLDVSPDRLKRTAEPAAAAGSPNVAARAPQAPAFLPDEPEAQDPLAAVNPRGSRLRSRAEQEIMSALGAKTTPRE